MSIIMTNTTQFKCTACGTEQATANTRSTGQYWCETCQSWQPIRYVPMNHKETDHG